jgi:hypothetical protein
MRIDFICSNGTWWTLCIKSGPHYDASTGPMKRTVLTFYVLSSLRRNHKHKRYFPYACVVAYALFCVVVRAQWEQHKHKNIKAFRLLVSLSSLMSLSSSSLLLLLLLLLLLSLSLSLSSSLLLLLLLLSLSSSLMLLLSLFIPFVSPYASPCQLPSTSDVVRQYSTLVKCCVYGNVLTHFPSKMWKTFSYVALVSRRELLFKHFCTMLFIQIQSRVFKYNHKSWKSITAR